MYLISGSIRDICVMLPIYIEHLNFLNRLLKYVLQKGIYIEQDIINLTFLLFWLFIVVSFLSDCL